MTTEIDRNAAAREQARTQLESIVAMVDRWNHANGCEDWNPDECEATATEIFAGLNLSRGKGEEPTDEMREEYHDEEKAREAIEESPLSVEIRSGWMTPGEPLEAFEFCILLCTGGPAVRVVGLLGNHGEPIRAEIEFGDWFTSWEELITGGSDHDALLTYARMFYFGS